MMRPAWALVAVATVVAGCERGPLSTPGDFTGAKWDIERVDALPRNPDPYFAELQDRAIAFAKAERAEFDWVDTAYFVDLAAAAQRGELRQPLNPEDRRLDEEQALLLSFPYVELTGFVNSEGGRLRAGPHIAAAQANFECWVQEAEEAHQEREIDECRDEFDAQMQIVRVLAPLPGDLAVVLSQSGGVQIDGGGNSTTLDRPFAAGSTAVDGGDIAVTEAEIREAFAASLEAAPAPPKLFRVTFGFNDYDLDDEDLGVIASAVDEALTRDHAEIIVTGHADAPGSRRENLLLSQLRARAVERDIRRLLVERGIPEGKVDIPRARARADRDRQLDTPEQAAENRRVEILVR